MSKKNGAHLNMSQALDAFIKKNKLQKGIDKVQVKVAWAKLMGNGVANYTTAVELQRDTLFVSLSSSVLREELSHGKSKIIGMMNEELGKNLIRKMVLR